ncbi:glycosyltransferase [Nocardioides sp. GCM10027113]|uniref:glycosyltransferase n=1 Tax=unclassified Nocardioides TaxID=2615069 RepID=UPI003619E9D1
MLYFNSFFDFRLSILPQILSGVAWWRGATTLVAPRGQFGSAALSIGARKKAIFISLYRALRLHRRVIWQASSEREADDIRAAMGSAAKVLVRRNDSLLPAPDDRPIPARQSGLSLRAVFVGRIVPIKGLDLLLQALQSVEHPLRLDVYGPDEDLAFANRCRDLAAETPNWVEVRFHGALQPTQVRPVVAEADLFVMPTRGENFGQVIAESLSVSVPVMMMDVTPWTETMRAGGGVVVPQASTAAWTRALNEYSELGAAGWSERRVAAALAYKSWFADRPKGDLIDQLGELNKSLRHVRLLEKVPENG